MGYTASLSFTEEIEHVAIFLYLGDGTEYTDQLRGLFFKAQEEVERRRAGSLLVDILSVLELSSITDIKEYFERKGLPAFYECFQDDFKRLFNYVYLDRRAFKVILDYLDTCHKDNKYFSRDYFQILLDLTFLIDTGFYNFGQPTISYKINKTINEEDIGTKFSMEEMLDNYKDCIDRKVYIKEYTYGCKSINDMVIASILHLMSLGLTVKKCKNCGCWFIPYMRSDTLYCDRISPQVSDKTCKEYGALKTYKDNLANDEAAGLYRKIYMAKMMLKRRNPDLLSYQKSFDDFIATAKQWKSDIKKGLKTNQQYIEWLFLEKEKKD